MEYVGWVQMNGITPSGVPGASTALQHCTAWLQAAVPGHPLQCDGLQRDDPRVRHRAAVERIHLAGAGGQQYYDMLTLPSLARAAPPSTCARCSW